MLTTYNNHSYSINAVCLKPSAGYLSVVCKPRSQSLPEELVFHNLCFIQTLPIHFMKAQGTKVIPKCVVLRIEPVSGSCAYPTVLHVNRSTLLLLLRGYNLSPTIALCVVTY